MQTNNDTRCEWLNKDPLYITYHDQEWGNAVYDSVKLFEILSLEIQQAGLSWLTVLKKRESYRKLFYNFEPAIISRFTQADIEKLSKNSTIIRHRGKIEAVVENAKAYINMAKNDESFSDFVWKFVNYQQVVNYWKSSKDIPADNKISLNMSVALKEKGFKFVGSKTCYAFMQASGLIDDHIMHCICRQNKG